ncbi:50S ribosomal protein L15 [bacterium]|nr:50S ribosomal protein L15 [bacterium]
MPGIQIEKHPSNVKRRRRKARGIAAGRGKTAGRGQKGQKSRSGASVHPRFEGGQTPGPRRLPKLGGFTHHRKIYYYPVNLREFTGAKAGELIDLAYLASHSLLPKKLRRLRVKLLGDGEFAQKLTFKLHAFSHRARARVEEAGGTCEVIE